MRPRSRRASLANSVAAVMAGSAWPIAATAASWPSHIASIAEANDHPSRSAKRGSTSSVAMHLIHSHPSSNAKLWNRFEVSFPIGQDKLPSSDQQRAGNGISCTFDDATADRITVIGVAQHQWCQSGIVRGPCFLGPGDCLVRVMIERAQHLRKQGGRVAAVVCCAKSQSDNLQADVGPAAFIRDWKSITGEADFAAIDQADTDGTCTGYDNCPVRAAVGAKTGGHAVTYEANRRKRMRNPLECSFRASTPKTSEADSGMQPREILTLQSGLRGCRFRGFHNGPPGLLDADPRCSWPRDPFAEQPTVSVFDTSPAATATPVNSEISSAFWRHRHLLERFDLGSSQSADAGISRSWTAL